VAQDSLSRPSWDAFGRSAAFSAVFGEHAAAAGGGEARGWAGLGERTVVVNTLSPAFSKVRQSFEESAPLATFCLDPTGWTGGWAARFVPALAFGCVPVNTRPRRVALAFEEHADVRWRRFAVRVPAPLGPSYNHTFTSRLVGAAQPDALSALRGEAGRVWTRVLGTSVSPLAADMGGAIRARLGDAPDAWQTLMEILGARVAAANVTLYPPS